MKVVYLPLFTIGFDKHPRWLGMGSLPSTVVHENKPNPKEKASSPKHHFSGGKLLNFRGYPMIFGDLLPGGFNPFEKYARQIGSFP